MPKNVNACILQEHLEILIQSGTDPFGILSCAIEQGILALDSRGEVSQPHPAALLGRPVEQEGGEG